LATKRDFYEVLEVPKNATDDEIKKSYRKMAMKYHPDRNPDNKASEEKFKEAKEAYEVLSDPQKKAAYDQYGHAGIDPSMGGFGGAGAQGFGGFADAFGDIFGDIFGAGGARGGRAGPQVFKGGDLRYSMEISLEEAARGHETQIRIPGWTNCDLCTGTGAEPGSKVETCSTCNGQGQVRMSQGFFSMQQTCPKCRGNGQFIAKPCKKCHGEGKTKQQKTLEVKIPAGIEDGMRIRLSGHGEPGINQGPPGDLYVEVHIKPHQVFERDGDDLHFQMPISYATACLGGEVQVPTLAGKASFEVAEGTQTGRTYRLRGKGIKGIRSSVPGDLYVHVQIETPVKLNDQQRKLIQELEKSLQADSRKHNPQERGWIDRVKDFFN